MTADDIRARIAGILRGSVCPFCAGVGISALNDASYPKCSRCSGIGVQAYALEHLEALIDEARREGAAEERDRAVQMCVKVERYANECMQPGDEYVTGYIDAAADCLQSIRGVHDIPARTARLQPPEQQGEKG